MHDIEPYHLWRDQYIASEDQHSPFFGTEYDEFHFTNTIYNYYIHPQWDDFGSTTLYLKVLYVNYEQGVCIIELIGEWNDCLQNDIMHLKRNVIEPLEEKGITKYILIGDNVLNFHGSDNCYYEEWYEDIIDSDGWICFINMLDHVVLEMEDVQIHHFVHLGKFFHLPDWRTLSPKSLFKKIEMGIAKKPLALL